MVTQAILDFANMLLGAVFSLVPEGVRAPGWIAGSANAVKGLFTAAATMGVWIPLDIAVAAALLIMNTYIGGGVVKGIRILISHFTGGGGGAA